MTTDGVGARLSLVAVDDACEEDCAHPDGQRSFYIIAFAVADMDNAVRRNIEHGGGLTEDMR